jgi:hypothetical protein
MNTSKRTSGGPLTTLVCGAVLTVFCLLAPAVVNAQWTASGNDISNTNTGNVGIGTGGTAPVYKLNVAGSEDKSQIRFGLGAFDSGGFLFSNAPTNAVFSGGAAWNGGWFAKGITASAIKMDTGTITFFTNGGLTTNALFTPTARMSIDTAGNVAIGQNAAAYRLDVQGGGQVNASGGLCINGDCKTAWSQVGGGSSQWTTSGSTIFFGNNVGIGTSGAPTRRLEVLGGNVFHQFSTAANSEFGFYTALNSNHFTSNLYYDGQWKMIGTGKAAVTVVAPTNNWAFGVFSDNTSRAANAVSTLSQLFTVTMGGNVGIGTATPDSLAKLHVYGSGGFGQDIQTSTNDWARLRLVVPSRTWGFFLDSSGASLGAAGRFGLFDYTANQWRMSWDTTGNVGIGTTAPVYSLDVNGGTNGFRAKAATTSSGDTIATFENSGAIQMIVRGNGNVGIGNTAPTEKLHVTGNLKVTGNIDVGGNINAKYQDMAEWVESSEDLNAGTVVVLDRTKNNQVVASTKSYDSRVAGVISVQPGIALGEQGEGHVLVATTGRVRVKVDATNGPIEIGDLLVTSDKTGVAMKSVPIDFAGAQIHRPGTLLGKALEPLAKGTGEILVLLSLQ